MSLPIKAVHASRGKLTRAEPVVAAYERGKVHHVGSFPALEDECCTWVPGVGDSPERLDALVWALTELVLEGGVSVCAPIFSTAPSRWAPIMQRADGGKLVAGVLLRAERLVALGVCWVCAGF